MRARPRAGRRCGVLIAVGQCVVQGIAAPVVGLTVGVLALHLALADAAVDESLEDEWTLGSGRSGVLGPREPNWATTVPATCSNRLRFGLRTPFVSGQACGAVAALRHIPHVVSAFLHDNPLGRRDVNHRPGRTRTFSPVPRITPRGTPAMEGRLSVGSCADRPIHRFKPVRRNSVPAPQPAPGPRSTRTPRHPDLSVDF
jgi:hypothetical protein